MGNVLYGSLTIGERSSPFELSRNYHILLTQCEIGR